MPTLANQHNHGRCNACDTDESHTTTGLYRWRDGERYCWGCIGHHAKAEPTDTLVKLHRCRKFKRWLAQATDFTYAPNDRISFALLDKDKRITGWIDFSRGIAGWKPGEHRAKQVLTQANNRLDLALRLAPLDELFGD